LWYIFLKGANQKYPPPITDLFCAPTFIFLTEQLEFNRKTANEADIRVMSKIGFLRSWKAGFFYDISAR